MWKMFVSAFKLFITDRLLRDPRMVAELWLVSWVASALMVIVLVKAGVPLWLTVAIVALGAGASQPYLFKNIKFK